ncbi:uncharacterized protein LOC132062041 [Lycium ferocissimum]|uniref:uncharacterized protein LOC132062041 n=1 Tax=Lycium ferocissimum TaxID=112874 RepID=UPI002816082F|nr:uncharacterized protein LOC132062041 [Lycium ferocissimum]
MATNHLTAISQPKFYKIILSPHECSRLRIPQDFASRYYNNMQSPARLEVPSGEVWKVEVVKSEGQSWLTKGWQDFIDYYSVKCGHFLMFGYNGHSHFNVTIFDMSASEIEYPCGAPHGTHTTESDDSVEIPEGIPRSHKAKTKSSDMVENSVENVGHCLLGKANKRKRVSVDMLQEGVASPSSTKKSQKIGYPRRSAHDTRTTESDDSLVILEGIPRSHRRKEKIPVAVEDSVEVIAHCSSGGSSKRKGREGDEENNVSVDMHFKRMEVEELPGDVASPSFSRKGQKIGYPHSALSYSFCSINPEPTNPQTWNPGSASGAAHGTRTSESDDSIEILEGMTRSYKVKAKVSDMVEHSVKNIGHASLGHASKRKRQEDEASPSFTKKGQSKNMITDILSRFTESGELCWMHKQQSKIFNDKNNTVMDKERSIAYQRAKAFKSKNPLIRIFMRPSYVFLRTDLSVPSTFARKYFLENSGDLVLHVPGRGTWSVKCTLGSFNAKIHSGWREFAADNELKIGDVCIFEVIKGTPLLIDVTIFPAAGSTPMQKIAGEVPGVSASKNKIIGTDNSVQPKVVQTKKLKKLRGVSYGSNSKIKEEHGEGTGIEHSVERLGNCQGSKRKRLEGEAETDVSIDRTIKVEKLQQDVALSSFTRLTMKSGESCRMHKQQDKIVNDKNKIVMDKERSIAYQRAKAFKSKNPFIIRLMQPSYISRSYNLRIRFTFARKYLRENYNNLVLRVPGRGSWSVKCHLRTYRAEILDGWKAFVLENKLKLGDVCVLEVIRGTPLFIDVTIFREAGSMPSQKIDGEVPEVSASKNKIIKTENSVQCSQPEIVHSKN